MRDLLLAFSQLESQLVEEHGVSLKEAMVLCSIGQETVTASMIVERTGLNPSHISKIIGAVEKRGLLKRQLGEKDKRQMLFTLTEDALTCLQGIRQKGVDVPEFLRPLFGGEKTID